MPAPPLTPGSLRELKHRVRERKTALLDHFRKNRPTATASTRLVRALARQVDEALVELWQGAAMPPGASLVAVGGYGRGELFPYSDVDVLVLLPAGDPLGSDGWRDAVGSFITHCWDIGLEIGSSVRTVAECVAEAARDVTVQTALLESRRLCGARRTFDEFRHAHRAAMDPKAFLRAKTLEMQQRHAKYENTPYSLEPNCKESPGGLRDLQVVIWVARAAGLGSTWSALAAKGLITRFEGEQLRHNEGLLRLIRARLHLVAGRREDRLVFDLQSAVAESFGLKPQRGQQNSEALMHRYYWAAKAVTQLNQILMLNIKERVAATGKVPMRVINARFLDRGGMLEVARDDVYQKNRHAILETFLVYQQTVGVKGLSARTLRALYNARELMDGDFRRDPINRGLFMDILRQPQGITHALRLMNETSVLGRYLWVFRRIVGRMQHDLFHVYTVDVHILMVLRNVRRFFIPEHAHEYPFCSQLAAQWDKPWVLFVAALFHDVAKGRGGDHSELGGRDVRRFCRDHGVAEEDAALCEFLVRHHLTMSRVAQKEDLTDPEVITRFARQMGDARHLTALYLLTVADIRGTSPKVWNAWKGKLLQDLYHTTLRSLGGAKPNPQADSEARKQDARQRLALMTAEPAIEEPLWATLDTRYFLRHEASDIAWHARALHGHLAAREPVVRARPSPVGEGLQVLVYAPDAHELFARICGYFDKGAFSILDARVHTTSRGYALDTFQVVSDRVDDQAPAAYRDLIALVETQLRDALMSSAPLPEPRHGRPSRRVRSFPVTPRVSLRPDERAQRWLLSVSTSDRSGLLYAIARVLAKNQINLQLAKISTLGERVEDTFLVDGPALRNSRAQLRIESELLDAVGPTP
ncbi:MAG: [protein-PII] uridylyltransferase [Rubrivivax sp.]|nr:[protein-PII] uridylyltransferase [Rubrivivax sp.]